MLKELLLRKKSKLLLGRYLLKSLLHHALKRYVQELQYPPTGTKFELRASQHLFPFVGLCFDYYTHSKLSNSITLESHNYPSHLKQMLRIAEILTENLTNC
jgi:hypothetical protein